MAAVKGEQLKKSTATKNVFHYVDWTIRLTSFQGKYIRKKIQKSIIPVDLPGGSKYETIEKIIYKGFNKKFPVGMIKAVTYGYGFTKTLNPIAYWLGEQFQITTVIIEKNGKPALDKKSFTLHLNEQNLKDLQGSMSSVFQRNRAELNLAVQTASICFFLQ